MIEDFRIKMIERYKMKNLDLLYHFLGLEIHQDNDGFFVEKRYTQKNIVMFGCSPLIVNEKLKKENR